MNAIPVDIAEAAVRSAGRAPSLHNSQPWRWVLDHDRLDLFAVPERMLPTTDPAGRQMYLSCGIALGHLRTALTAQGWRTIVAYFPDPNRRTHVATVRFTPHRPVIDSDRDRAAAIEQRYTERAPLGHPTGWDDFETVLRSTFAPVDAELDVISEKERPVLARASTVTAGIRYRDAEYQAELLWWTQTPDRDTGVPDSARLSATESARVPLGRSFPVAEHSAEKADTLDQATVLVVSTDSDNQKDLLRGGEALSTILLECTLAGYATCVLTHLTEYSYSRSIIRELIGIRTLPQALVRVGIAPEGQEKPRTPRLPLGEILRIVD